MILAIDTATRMINVALGSAQGLIAEVSWPTANNHTRELHSQQARCPTSFKQLRGAEVHATLS